jgi:hypothetical protein
VLIPPLAWRVPRDANTDTPLPADEPFAPNPPNGAIIDYVLPRGAAHVSLTFADAQGRSVRRFASDDASTPADPAALEAPAWWIAPPAHLDASEGAHRFVWDLHVAAPRTFSPYATIAAIPHGTPLEPEGPTVPPGRYTVTLDADGVKSAAPFFVHEDPRTDLMNTNDLVAQYELATAIARRTDDAYAAAERVRARDAALAAELERANGRLAQLLSNVETGDGAPTAVQRAGFRERSGELDALLRRAARVAK